MPELPEIYNLACQMNKELKGKTIQGVEIRQHKCLNTAPDEFTCLACGKKLSDVTSKGKWIFVKLYPDTYFLLSLGMGGDLLYHKPGQDMPDKYQLAFTFDDGSRLSIRFWWFGYAHAVNAPDSHKMTSKLGISPISDEFTYQSFNSMLKSKRGTIKSVLLDQSSIAGIGNVYVQDILFRARLHPDRKVPAITEEEKMALYDAIKENLRKAISFGGITPEMDLYGNPGRFTEFMVGYREGKPCPECGTTIEKIRTGSTSSYICPKCQR